MWRIEFAAAAEQDFDLIFDHLCASYVALGDDPVMAVDRAADRICGIRSAIGRLAETPFVGTKRPEIREGVRFVRRDRAAIWFLPIEEDRTVRVLAVFFGAQDHIRHMLIRMLEE